MRYALPILLVMTGCATTSSPEPLHEPPPRRRLVELIGPEQASRPLPRPPVPVRLQLLAPDIERVSAASTFATAGVGVTGHLLEEHAPLVRISRSPLAVDALEWLARHASPAGQLLAVWALRSVTAKRAAKHLVRLRGVRRTVAAQSGCIMYVRPVGTIATQIAKDEVGSFARIASTTR